MLLPGAPPRQILLWRLPPRMISNASCNASMPAPFACIMSYMSFHAGCIPAAAEIMWPHKRMMLSIACVTMYTTIQAAWLAAKW